MPVEHRDILDMLAAQDRWRGRETMNLVASETVLSPLCRRVQDSDLIGRYAEGLPGDRLYQGTHYFDELERLAVAELRELLGCRHVDVRGISGTAVNMGLALTLLQGGDAVIAPTTQSGGHFSHAAIGAIGRRVQVRGMSLRREDPDAIPLHPLPMQDDGLHVDVPATLGLMDHVKPRVVLVGRSIILFPEPVRELAEACRGTNTVVWYDGAHVLGLIAGGQFQSPLAEGAAYLTASTHKTFPGPQRGIVASDDATEDLRWWRLAEDGVSPVATSNYHLHSLPGLIIATREMARYGRDYAAQTVANARHFARRLHDAGLDVIAREHGFTETHMLLVDCSAHGGGKATAQRLEENGIICNASGIPGRPAAGPRGIRLGTQEMTRWGMGEQDFSELADLVADCVKHGGRVKDRVHALRSRFQEVQYA